MNNKLTVISSTTLILLSVVFYGNQATSAQAQDKVSQPKTAEQIEAYKNQNRKTPEQIEAHKNQLRLNKEQMIKDAKTNKTQKVDQVKTNTSNKMQEVKTQIDQKTQEARSKRCEQTQAQFNARINRYEDNKDKHTDRYRNLIQKISDFLDRAESRGCDVSSVKMDIQADKQKVEELITQFHAAQRMFTNTMQNTRSLACSPENSAETRQMFQESRQNSQEVRQAAQAIQTYITKTMRPKLVQAIKTCQSQNNQDQ
jgi:hypothetical protein